MNPSSRRPGAPADRARRRKEALQAVVGGARPVLVRRLGRVEYRPTLEAMQRFTASRDPLTPDELWVLEHPPVYTVGLAGRSEHLPRRQDIPLERVDRGGQVTYHGPGQAVVYAMIDLPRRGLKVRELVCLVEEAVIGFLAASGTRAHRVAGAPGVYVDGAKIAALGLRVRRGCTYHGLAFNVDMDLEPYLAIDPCGYPGLPVTQARNLGLAVGVEEAGAALAERLGRLIEEHERETD